MGDLGTSLTSDLYGVYFNPASTSGITESYVGFMHHENIFDSRREFLGGTTPALGGGVSIGFDYFKIGSIESREGPSDLPIGTFDAQDILFYGGYARNFAKNIAIGFTGKYAAERIDSKTAATLLFDVGGQYHLENGVTIGVAARNLGSKPSFVSEKISLPVAVSGGISATMHKITAGGEITKISNSDLRINLGAERYIVDFLALRAGYKFGYDEENVAFGAGFVKSIWSIDYAFVPFKSGLGSNHRFSLTVQLK